MANSLTHAAIRNQLLSSTRLSISLEAIRENLALLNAKLNVAPVLKANAYGTAILELAKFYERENVPFIVVAHPQEALELKDAGVQTKIFVVHACPDEAPILAEHGIAFGVSDLKTVKALKGLQATLHLHVDTGMGRLGVPVSEAPQLINEIQKNEGISLEGIYSHLAVADVQEDDPFTWNQYQKFCSILDLYPFKWRHLANSSGLLRFRFPKTNLARVGLALFGETLSKESQTLPLKRALSLESKVLSLQKVGHGETIGYGRGFENRGETMLIATVPFGYHDGMDTKSKSSYFIHGKKAPIVGGVTMDFSMCDVTDFEEIAIGDRVEIFGNQRSLTDFANECGQNGHQILAKLGPRVVRLFNDHNSISKSLKV